MGLTWSCSCLSRLRLLASRGTCLVTSCRVEACWWSARVGQGRAYGTILPFLVVHVFMAPTPETVLGAWVGSLAGLVDSPLLPVTWV